MRILVIRFSAMGDVALTVPALSGLLEKYPDNEVIMLTRNPFQPLFSPVKNVRFFSPDLKGRHKGIPGIYRIYRDIRDSSDPDIVVDLHDVLRSKMLRLLFRIAGKPVFILDKGRKEKKLLISGKKKVFLKHTVERYSETFARAGFPIVPSDKVIIQPGPDALKETHILFPGGDYLKIGVAPFARHNLKMWPEENMIRLLKLIAEGRNSRFYLFGGIEDAARMEHFQSKIPGALNVTGKYKLETELALMSRLDLMIAMDSSNMHMAALTGTRVISIWGGTDPMAGFGPWMQPENYSIRVPVEELDCRPCTIYGKGKSRNNFKCMTRLTPEIVYRRMLDLKVI